MKRPSLSVPAVLVLAGLASAGDLQKGIALYGEGKYAEAEAELRGVTGAEASAYLAASLAKQKKYAEAEAPARAALEPNPAHAVAAAALGESLVGQGKFDEAITRLTAAIKEKADIAYAYYWRAQAYHNKKEVARMVEDYQTFLRLAPNAPEAAAVKILLGGLR
jgi:tetratricopeptide (TPR) repeat protein